MKPARILFIIMSLVMWIPMSAQFTIKDTPELEIPEFEDIEEAVIVKPEYKFDYINEAQRREMRKKRRRDRNYLELYLNMSFTQTSFGNWYQDTENNLNTSAKIEFVHRFNITKFSLETKFNARYGLNYVEKKKFKNIDDFTFSLAPNWKIHKHWSYSAYGELKSQFFPGYKNREDEIKRNDFMSPGSLKLSAGITYQAGPLKILFSPISGDARFVLNKEMSDKGWHGVEKGKRAKWAAGPSVKLEFDKKFFKDVVRVWSKIYSFSDMHSNPNFDWETNIYVKATKFLETTINYRMYYDELSKADKPKSMQYRSIITFGLSHRIKNK